MTDQPSAVDLVTGEVMTCMGRTPGVQVIGLCGAQGSGKSTIALEAAARLASQGVRCACLSLDDLYLGHQARTALASDLHPLFATRGPPGTHDVPLGRSILQALRAGEEVLAPVFDKLADDRLPQSQWRRISAQVDAVLFEGWCVGARAQDSDALVQPVNALERDEDANRVWRTYANDALAGSYHLLFDELDALIMLKAPSFDVVARWRLEQEGANRIQYPDQPDRPTMDEAQVARFIQFYERITRAMLIETPGRADLVLDLDEQRQVSAITRR